MGQLASKVAAGLDTSQALDWVTAYIACIFFINRMIPIVVHRWYKYWVKLITRTHVHLYVDCTYVYMYVCICMNDVRAIFRIRLVGDKTSVQVF